MEKNERERERESTIGIDGYQSIWKTEKTINLKRE